MAANKPIKESAFKQKKDKILHRREAVESISPITHKLRLSSEIFDIHKALHQIYIVEDKARYDYM